MSDLVPRSGGTLASDAERERAALALRRHYGEGRLEADELERRLEVVWGARTRRDLAQVFRDLPRRGPVGRLRDGTRAALVPHAVTSVTVNGGLVGIWAATGGGDFWPGWALAPSAMALGSHLVALRMLDLAGGALRRGRRPGGRGPRRPRA